MVCCFLAGRSVSQTSVVNTRRTSGGVHLQVTLKIPRALFERAIADLRRPHPFAAERVGFFSTRTSLGKNLVLIHCVAYHPVSDSNYLRDYSVGARINSDAILEAMN